jgi:DNA-binding beta-propeller fold protein YncE
MQVLAP